MAIRVAHLSDPHVTDGPRLAHTIECIDRAVDIGAREGVDLWLVGGDLHGRVVPHESTLSERNALDVIFQKMADQAPVHIVAGNHDAPGDLVGYGRLHGSHSITVHERPQRWHVVSQRAATGEIRESHLIVLPYPDKATLLGVDALIGAPQATNRTAAERVNLSLRELVSGGSAPFLSADLPRILAAHINIAGAVTGGGEIMADREIELTPADLDALDFDYIALGHIHAHQQVAKRAWYCGSPTAQEFGDETVKGFIIAEVERGREPVVNFHPTGARRLVTVTANLVNGTWQLDRDIPADAEVRVKVSLSEDEALTAPHAYLEHLVRETARQGSDASVHSVRVDARVLPTERVRSEAVARAGTIPDRIAAYWDSIGSSAPSPESRARCLGLLDDIVGLSDRDAIASADGLVVHRLKSRGSCRALPGEIEIDFDKLDDGVVCWVGANGSGKSHLIAQTGPLAFFGEDPYYDEPFSAHAIDANAFTELEFSVASGKVRTLTTIGESFAWLNNEPLSPSGKITPYRKAMLKLIPPPATFYATAFAAQRDRANFFDLKREARRDLFAKLLGLEGYQAMAKEAAARQVTAQSSYDVLVNSVGDLTLRNDAAGQISTDLVIATDTYDRLHADAVVIDRDCNEAGATVNRLSDAAMEAKLALNGASAAVETGATNVKNVMTLRAGIDAELAELAELTGRADEINDAMITVAALRADITTDERAREDQRAWRQEINQKLLEHRLGLAEARRVRAELATRIALAETSDMLAATLDVAIAEVNAAKAALAETDASITRLTEQTATLRADAVVDVANELTRMTLVAERAGYERQAAALADGVDLSVEICSVCPLTRSAVQARAEIGEIDEHLAALAPSTGAAEAIAEVDRDLAGLRALRDYQAGEVRAYEARVKECEDALVVAAELPGLITEAGAVSARVDDLANTVEQEERDERTTVEGDRRLTERIDDAKKKIAELEPVANLAPRLAHAIERRDKLTNEVVTLTVGETVAVAAHRSAVEHATASQAAYDEAARACQAAQDRWAALRVQWNEAKTALDAAMVERDVLQRRYADYDGVDSKLAEASASCIAAGEASADWRALAAALGRDGVQAYMIDAAGPGVSFYTNAILEDEFDSKFSVKVITSVPKADGSGSKEVFDIILISADAGEITRGSGGEMALVNEALRLGIAEWNKDRDGVHPRTMWRDETAEGLSPDNQMRYVNILRRARRLAGLRHIHFVSHTPAVYAAATHRIFVEDGKVRID